MRNLYLLIAAAGSLLGGYWAFVRSSTESEDSPKSRQAEKGAQSNLYQKGECDIQQQYTNM